MLRPQPTVSPEALDRGKQALVKDAAWASMVGALYGGVILTGFALEIGAMPWHIGLLAAIPFLAQIAQLPAIAVIERVRQRKKIAVVSVSISRIVISLIALVALIPDPTAALYTLLGAQVLVSEASRSIVQLSPIDGLKDVLLFPLGRLRDRRVKPR